MNPSVKHFFDPNTFTLTYVVWDAVSKDAVIVDPVLDFSPITGRTDTASAQQVVDFAKQNGLNVHYSMETHAHADHLSAGPWLREQLGAKVAIGARITEVQETFKAILDLDHLATDGSQFDRLLAPDDVLHAGTLDVRAIPTPGHTPACMSFLVGDAVFTGDALFMEDYGTGRCDFPKGDSGCLYTSIHERLYKLPEATRVFVGHDYQPGGREVRAETTIGTSKQENVQLTEATPREAFVAMRNARDSKLDPPKLLWPSIQVNANGGLLPPAAKNGLRFLKTPMNLRRPTTDSGAPLPQ